jgi:glycyl-tRNA synthetase
MEKWFEYWKEQRMSWFKSYFTHSEKLGFFKHEKLAHYAKKAFDIQYDGKEIEGIHWRGDWDLSQHSKFSGQDLSYTPEGGERFIPNIVETSGGVDRMFMFLLLDAYEEVKGGRGGVIASEAKQSSSEVATSSSTSRNDSLSEVVMHFNPKIAPVKAAVLPLSKKLSEKAKEIYQDLKSEISAVEFDEGGSIGKRYRRQDEIGTPFCITYDFDSESDKKVTVRNRDTMKQERIAISEIKEYIKEKLK